MSGFPPELFTKDNRSVPDSVYEELARDFPLSVRRNEDGDWAIDVFDGNSGRFSAAIKELHRRSGAGSDG